MENKDIIIAAWIKVIDVQQHFNDIELRIRNYALTMFTFIIAAIGYLLKENSIIYIGNQSIVLPAIVGYIGAVIILAFFFMDKYWYHKFLIGAVKQAMYIEKKYRDIYPELLLSSKIADESPIKFSICCKSIEIHSSKKISIFYFAIFHVLFLASTILWLCICSENLFATALLIVQVIFIAIQLFDLFRPISKKNT